MRRSVARLALLLVALLAAGCQSVQQGRAFGAMNDELFELYRAKLESRDESGVVLREDAKARLRDLAAEARGQAAQASEPADRIAFQRIAAVAAWQGESSDVLEIADAGRSSCDEAPRGWNQAPRDCALIAVAGDLAVADAAARRVAELKARFPQPANDVPAEEEPEIAELVGLMLSRHERLAGTLTRLEALDAPPAFSAQLRKAMNDVACNAGEAYALLTHVMGVDRSVVDELGGRLQEAAPRRVCAP